MVMNTSALINNIFNNFLISLEFILINAKKQKNI